MLLSDPRGSVNAAVNLITPPVAPDADLGMIVIESDHYPPMSGSNLICTVSVALETGMVPMIEPVTRLCVGKPTGVVGVAAEWADGKWRGVTFRDVTGFMTQCGHTVREARAGGEKGKSKHEGRGGAE